MSATRGAPIGEGRYGLILLSHGTGGGRLNHRDTAIRLAETGYIVAAPEHAGDSWRDEPIQRYVGELAPAPAPVERGAGSAPRRRRVRPPHRPGAHRGRGALGRRLQRARADRRPGRTWPCSRVTAPVVAQKTPSSAAYGRSGGHDNLPMPDLSDPRVDAVAGRRAGRRAVRRWGVFRRYSADTDPSTRGRSWFCGSLGTRRTSRP